MPHVEDKMPKKRDEIASWITHIESLASGIGPRGSTTEAERQGAAYCHTVLADLGFQPRTEPFRSARSIFLPHVIAAGVMRFRSLSTRLPGG